jgi:hypothetical protein
MEDIVPYTPDEIMSRGLQLIGFEPSRQQGKCDATRTRFFKESFGSKPIVYAQIWEDLQTTANPEAKIDAREVDIDQLLMALFFLTC